jgi:nitrite reductase/ring-hydroxylating ferredoxin subunit
LICLRAGPENPRNRKKTMRIEVAKLSDIDEGKTHCVKIDGLKVLMTKINGDVHAIENRCSHLGLSMEKGELKNGVIECPWHGSRFDIATGKNVDWVNSIKGRAIPEWSRKIIGLGKKPEPVKVFQTVVENDTVYIEQS